ncbi:uncharacterized protein GGS22DRAFT_113887 [Annulohypoxylon maeteangense]|uniref:uncharacterized protein n=1 Tax=Annulohypoxylon maeteangense TaxID=1927788 RepID=UPI0020073C84|nr:uncharacterized protein GGS22DRAFT_113887 [Annulohypoxylon maeteangense]KAI0886465.1 hypothetical protein GGS22DRAFT_113887 [Annulohypoxylon maeteangense]
MALIFSHRLICRLLFLFSTIINATRAHRNETKLHIAIVGAGITGASVAYHLNSVGADTSIAITVFEKDAQLGGRVQSNQYYGNLVAELGALHFSESDQCLMSAVDSFGLNKKPASRPVGLWNGTELLHGSQGLGCAVGVEAGSGTLRDLITWASRVYFPPPQVRGIINKAKEDLVLWATRVRKHGVLAPWKFHHASASDLERWKQFGSENNEPFNNFQSGLDSAGLSGDVLGSTEEYAGLAGSRFSREAVEPCTRALVSQNLDHVRALSAVISDDPGRVISLWYGNVRLIEDMIKRSGAILKTDSRVTRIKTAADRRYSIKTDGNDNNGEFDIVLLAGGPNQDLSSILSDVLPPHQIPAPSHYTETHVTLFTTEQPLHLPRSESPEQDVAVPQGISAIYFTNNFNSNMPELLHAYSIYAAGNDEDCEIEFECDEFVYRRVHRIVSRSALSDTNIARLAGLSLEAGETLEEKDITDVRRAAWPHAFPIYENHGDESWKNIELAPGLLYLGGGEKLHSSLEMGCRMGRNAARLMRVIGEEAGRVRASEELENRHDGYVKEL